MRRERVDQGKGQWNVWQQQWLVKMIKVGWWFSPFFLYSEMKVIVNLPITALLNTAWQDFFLSGLTVLMSNFPKRDRPSHEELRTGSHENLSKFCAVTGTQAPADVCRHDSWSNRVEPFVASIGGIFWVVVVVSNNFLLFIPFLGKCFKVDSVFFVLKEKRVETKTLSTVHLTTGEKSFLRMKWRNVPPPNLGI